MSLKEVLLENAGAWFLLAIVLTFVVPPVGLFFLAVLFAFVYPLLVLLVFFTWIIGIFTSLVPNRG